LQTRNGKRTAVAAIKIAVDMVREGLLTEAEAVMRIEPDMLEQFLFPKVDPSVTNEAIATGLPASPGAASGEIVLHADDVKVCKAQGRNVILVRVDTSPGDVHGMHEADGILTARGGLTSHAAVIARGIGRPCVTGASSLHIDYTRQTVRIAGKNLKVGDIITIDGASGEIFHGAVKLCQPELASDVRIVMAWMNKYRRKAS